MVGGCVGVRGVGGEDVEDGGEGAVVAGDGAGAVGPLAHGVVEDGGELAVGDGLVGVFADAHAAEDGLLKIH